MRPIPVLRSFVVAGSAAGAGAGAGAGFGASAMMIGTCGGGGGAVSVTDLEEAAVNWTGREAWIRNEDAIEHRRRGSGTTPVGQNAAIFHSFTGTAM